MSELERRTHDSAGNEYGKLEPVAPSTADKVCPECKGKKHLRYPHVGNKLINCLTCNGTGRIAGKVTQQDMDDIRGLIAGTSTPDRSKDVQPVSPNGDDEIDNWFNENFLSGDRSEDWITFQFSGWDVLKALIAQRVLQGRIDERENVKKALQHQWSQQIEELDFTDICTIIDRLTPREETK